MAENVVLWPSAGHGKEEILTAQASVQIAVCRAVGDEEVYTRRDWGRGLQIRPRGRAVELDAVVLKAFILQIDNAIGNQALGSVWIGVEYPVVIPWDKDSELCREGRVPGEEVRQIGRIETLAGISGTDEDVGICGHVKTPIHPMGVGKSEELMAFVLDEHINPTRTPLFQI